MSVPSALTALLLALVAALAASTAIAPTATAGEPECEETPAGEVCTEVDEPTCEPPECAAPPYVHAWPDPVGSSAACAAHTTDGSPTTNCPPVVATASAGGGKAVASVSPTTPGVSGDPRGVLYHVIGCKFGCP